MMQLVKLSVKLNLVCMMLFWQVVLKLRLLRLVSVVSNALTALSTTEDPERSSIPFDKDRNGFVMGKVQGSCHRKFGTCPKRGANILAEIVGYGSNCDAYHMTTPTPDGSGAAKAIKLAINEAGIKPEDVDYVNAHGTSTPANEKGESGAIVSVLGKEVPVSSTKSFTGHLLGAAGAVEAIATIEAIRHSFVPKLLVLKNCLTISKQTLFMVKVKKQIFSTLSQIPLVLEDTMLFWPLNVGRVNS